MSHRGESNVFREIPSVDEILSHGRISAAAADHPGFPWTRVLRAVLDEFRGATDPVSLAGGETRAHITKWAVTRTLEKVETLRCGGLRPVINGTGVILHTNLGRAPVGDDATRAAAEALSGYVSLEVDMHSGERGPRATVLGELVALATGGEAAMVVNNNAAAVYLAVNSYSPPGRVVVSRGELVEIGGSFRLPEILRHAAAEVVEVGTTNRTYAKDYAAAAKPGDVLLKVHKSNYAIEGFAHEAAVRDLVAVARDTGGHVIYDLGSGALVDFSALGAEHDRPVPELVTEGVDCITMSGDKLLGGVQAGLIVGRSDFIAKLKENPMRRAVRVDKVTVAALQSVLRAYLFDADPTPTVPVLAHTFAPIDALVARAETIVEAVTDAASGYGVSAVDDTAAVGGGSLSAAELSSAAVAIRCGDEKAAVRFARRLRAGRPPVFTRIRGAEVRINMRTVRPGEDEALVSVLRKALAASPRNEES